MTRTLQSRWQRDRHREPAPCQHAGGSQQLDAEDGRDVERGRPGAGGQAADAGAGDGLEALDAVVVGVRHVHVAFAADGQRRRLGELPGAGARACPICPGSARSRRRPATRLFSLSTTYTFPAPSRPRCRSGSGSRPSPVPRAPHSASTAPAGESLTTRSLPVSATYASPEPSTATASGWSNGAPLFACCAVAFSGPPSGPQLPFGPVDEDAVVTGVGHVGLPGGGGDGDGDGAAAAQLRAAAVSRPTEFGQVGAIAPQRHHAAVAAVGDEHRPAGSTPMPEGASKPAACPPAAVHCPA